MAIRTIFCLNCGTTGRAEVPAPDPYRSNGTTADGTPMPGYCLDRADCQEAATRLRATGEWILASLG